jgi:hypothetical protein
MRKEAIIGGAFVAAAGILAVAIYALSPVAGATTSSTLHLSSMTPNRQAWTSGARGPTPGTCSSTPATSSTMSTDPDLAERQATA